MSNVLENIVANKREEIKARISAFPEEKVTASLTPSTRSLFEALKAPNAGYILECKKASPSKGLIRPVFDLDEILAAYTPFAAGISVLTDEKYFQGSYDYLAYVAKQVSQPVLNKDFFISEYQVHLARYHHADAILLMLSVLSDDEYQKLAAVAEAHSLDILTEVSNEEEMQRAIALRANIIGINNRDLRDLSTDLGTTEKLVPMLKAATHDYVVVSESGIYTHQDVLRLAPLCDGFLVGSALMAQQHLPAAVQSLLYGTIKVCGITSAHDAKIAFDAGASFCGLIFAEQSKRYMDLSSAKNVVESVPGQYVGVFVNAPVDQVAEYARQLALTAVQLHGAEDAQYRQKLTALLPPDCALWQAVGVQHTLPATLPALLEDATVSKVLLDCQVGTSKGGTGQTFDWSLLANVKQKDKLVLAGGVNASNVQQAKATGAAIIDVNSGVETAPGKKSPEMLSDVFTRCRQY